MNRITVSEGRMPETVGECLVDDASDYQIGDQIVLTSGTEDPVSDTLRTDTLTVVGRGNTAAYVSFGRGSATIGTGSIYAFVVVPADTFELDTFTEVYLQVEGAKALTAFTDAYDDKIASVQTRVEDCAEERGVIRKAEIVQDAEEEIADAEQELADGKKEAKKELRKARKEIRDGEKELADAKKQIEDGRDQIAEAKDTLNTQQEKLDESRKEYQDGKKALEKGWKQYKKGKKKFEKARPEAEEQIEGGEAQLKALKDQIAEDEQTYDNLKKQLSQLENAIRSSQDSAAQKGGDSTAAGAANAAADLQNQLTQLKTAVSGMEQKLTMEKSAASKAEKELKAAKKELSDGEKTLSSTKKTLREQEKKLDSAKEQLTSGQKQIGRCLGGTGR